tara:strand:- start:10890 stop:11183 length:294 start_codon:yes stop_codon:yes gene_type:complete
MQANNHFSDHAIRRSQQRAIPEIVIQSMIEYGQPIPVRDKATSYTLTLDALKEAKSELPDRIYQCLEKKKNAYVIVSEDGIVITTAWSKKSRFKFAA